MDLKHMPFLQQVQEYIEKHPEVGAYVSDFVARGIEASRMETINRAADMEAALAVALSKRYDGRKGLILQKLRKWRDKSSLRWDDTIKELEDALCNNSIHHKKICKLNVVATDKCQINFQENIEK